MQQICVARQENLVYLIPEVVNLCSAMKKGNKSRLETEIAGGLSSIP